MVLESPGTWCLQTRPGPLSSVISFQLLVQFLFIYLFILVQGIKPRPLHMIGKHYTSGPYPQALVQVYFFTLAYSTSVKEDYQQLWDYVLPTE
jgi:hypothetical protein